MEEKAADALIHPVNALVYLVDSLLYLVDALIYPVYTSVHLVDALVHLRKPGVHFYTKTLYFLVHLADLVFYPIGKVDHQREDPSGEHDDDHAEYFYEV